MLFSERHTRFLLIKSGVGWNINATVDYPNYERTNVSISCLVVYLEFCSPFKCAAEVGFNFLTAIIFIR